MFLMRIPTLRVDRDVGDARLDQTARGKTALPESIAPVTVTHFLRFEIQVERLCIVAVDDSLRLRSRFFERDQFRTPRQSMSESIQLLREFQALPDLFRSHVSGRHETVHLEFRGIRIRSCRKRFVFIA